MARNFENIFNECVEAMLRGESVERCLERYPEHASELEPLLRTAASAREASSTMEPRPEFKARLTYQIRSGLGANNVKRRARRRPSFRHMPRWAAATIMIVLALLIATGGTVAAASDSVPGDVLYPVKIATENVRMAFAFSDIGKANLQAEFANRRIEELESIADRGNPELVEALMQRFEDHLSRIEALAPQLVQGNGSTLDALRQRIRDYYDNDTTIMQRIRQRLQQHNGPFIERLRLRINNAYENLLEALDAQ